MAGEVNNVRLFVLELPLCIDVIAGLDSRDGGKGGGKVYGYAIGFCCGDILADIECGRMDEVSEGSRGSVWKFVGDCWVGGILMLPRWLVN
jgi:hypothetical protein